MEAGGKAQSSPTETSFRSAARRRCCIAERCSPARVRCAALTRALARSAPFRKVTIRDGRLRRKLSTRFLLTNNSPLMEDSLFRCEGFLAGVESGAKKIVSPWGFRAVETAEARATDAG